VRGDGTFASAIPEQTRRTLSRCEASPVNIEVFADIWCPFTHVGLRAIDEQRWIRARGDVGIVVRSWPLELINGAPMDPVAVLHPC
jgi:hypothetical protein